MYRYVINFTADLLGKKDYDWTLETDKRMSVTVVYDLIHKKLRSHLQLIPKNVTINKLEEYKHEEIL